MGGMSMQNDIRRLLAEAKLSQKEFAALAGVNACALSKFMHRTGRSLAERLVPYVYGEGRPSEKSAPRPAMREKGGGE